MVTDNGSFNWPTTASGSVPIYATFSDFPSGTQAGDLAVAADTGNLFEWNGSAWQLIASPGDLLSLGAFGSTPNADGASASGNVLTLQPADGTHPGGISITTQTIAGQKTFSTGLTGTLTGAASLNVLTSALGNFTDSTSAADGITVTGGTAATVGSVSIAQAAASASQNGYLTSTDWSTFNGKQASGSYITALTGNVTASGPGSATATIAAGAVTLARMANLAANSIIGNNTGSPATPIALTVSQVNTLLGTLSNPMTTLGDVIYGGVSGTPTRLAGNTTTTPNFYTSTGAASAATAPTLTASTGSGNVVLATSPTLVTPALGTPSALVGTNITGTATSFTASNVTTNANLTGVVTSVGNATSYPSQSANTVLAGPTSGAAAASAFRQQVYADISPALKAPTVQVFLNQPNAFTVSSGTFSGTAGAVYTDGNSNSYTLATTFTTSATSLSFTSTIKASSIPASGTLTKQLGTGSASITYSAVSSGGTYTRPTSPSPLYIKVRMSGGGGGGGGSGTTTTGGTGVTGTSSTFGSSLLTCMGGGGGGNADNGSPGAGGTATATGLSGILLSGSYGSGNFDTAQTFENGGNGGMNALGGSGSSAGATSGAPANTGGGGAGAGVVGVSAVAGFGGGAGGYLEVILTSPSSTYAYNVGLGGLGGLTGTSGSAGGVGGNGIIYVEEYYQ